MFLVPITTGNFTLHFYCNYCMLLIGFHFLFSVLMTIAALMITMFSETGGLKSKFQTNSSTKGSPLLKNLSLARAVSTKSGRHIVYSYLIVPLHGFSLYSYYLQLLLSNITSLHLHLIPRNQALFLGVAYSHTLVRSIGTFLLPSL